MKPPRRVAFYSRVSTMLQATDGMSLDAQEKAILEYCARQDWPEPVRYVDAGRSAYKEAVKSRPVFARLLADIADGWYDAVVVWHLNRWARRTTVTLDTLAQLERAGTTLVSLSQPIDTSSAVGKLTLTLLAGIAQFESDERSESAKRIHAELKGQGKLSSGRPPWGARLDAAGRLEIDPAQADNLRRLLSLAESQSDFRVAEALNASGVAPPGAGIKREGYNPVHWWPRSVRAIVLKADWLLKQPEPWPSRYLAARNRPRLAPTGHHRTTRALSGLVRCGACGGSVSYGTTRGSTPWLRCQRPGCRAHYGPAAPHEQFVIAAAMRLTPRPHLPDLPGIDNSALASLTAERHRLVRLYRDPRAEITDDDYEQSMADIDRRERLLRTSAAPARDLGDLALALPALDHADSPAAVNALLRQVISSVKLSGRTTRIVTWLPEAETYFQSCA